MESVHTTLFAYMYLILDASQGEEDVDSMAWIYLCICASSKLTRIQSLYGVGG